MGTGSCVSGRGALSLSGSPSVYSLNWCACACMTGRGLCVPGGGGSGYVRVCHSVLEELFPGSRGPTRPPRPAPLMQGLGGGN